MNVVMFPFDGTFDMIFSVSKRKDARLIKEIGKYCGDLEAPLDDYIDEIEFTLHEFESKHRKMETIIES